MKKLISAILCAALIIAASGCSQDISVNASTTTTAASTTTTAATTEGTTAADETSTTAAETSTEAVAESSESKLLVAYFTPSENSEADAISQASQTVYDGETIGSAAAIARMIAKRTGADMFSIQTVKDYPVVYDDLADFALDEQNRSELPELATHTDISGYDTVFVVYPVWWYTMPQSIYSFFEEYDFAGKNIIPVTTHAGSRLADSLARIGELEPDATITSSFTISAMNVETGESEVTSWLAEIGY